MQPAVLSKSPLVPAIPLDIVSLQPSITVTPSITSRIDWSLNWEVISRTGFLILWAWGIGYIRFSALWVLLVGLLIVFSITRQRKHFRFHETLKFQKRMHAPAALQSSLPLIPPWISFPDIEKADFITTLCTQMWPSIKQATEAQLRAQLPPIIDKLKPPFLTSITFNRLDLGNIPPSIPGVRLQQTDSADELMLDMEVEFSGNPQIIIEASTGPVSVTVRVEDFFFRGTVRALLKPLIDEIPCFAAISVSLVTRPTINFKLNTVGVSVMAIPGLNDALYELIKTQVAAFVVWPKKIVIPLKKLSDDVLAALNTAEVQGILYVRVLGAKDIRSGDVYAKVTLGGGQKKKTHSKKHHGAVEWNECFELYVHDQDNDEVKVELKAKDNLLVGTVNTLVINQFKTQKSTALGDVSIPVNRVSADSQANVPQDLWLPLQHQHKGKAGQVHVELTWSPFRTNAEKAGEDTGRPMLRRRSTRHIGLASGLLMVTLHSAHGLRKGSSSHAAHNVYCVLMLGKSEVKTGTASASKDKDTCSWEAQFDLAVDDATSQQLRVELREKHSHLSSAMHLGMGHAKDVVLGEVVVSMAQAAKEDRKSVTLPIQKQPSATLSLTYELKET